MEHCGQSWLTEDHYELSVLLKDQHFAADLFFAAGMLTSVQELVAEMLPYVENFVAGMINFVQDLAAGMLPIVQEFAAAILT